MCMIIFNIRGILHTPLYEMKLINFTQRTPTLNMALLTHGYVSYNLNDMIYEIYHPFTLDGKRINLIDDDLRLRIIEFVEADSHIENFVEIFDKSLSIPCFVGVVSCNNDITGVVFTILLRVSNIITNNIAFLSGTSDIIPFLRNSISEYGYFMAPDYNSSVSWYRPINVSKVQAAGIKLGSFSRRSDVGKTMTYSALAARRRVAYSISNPDIIPRKISQVDYEVVLPIFRRDDPYLNPTFKEFGFMCEFFDIYIVEENIFMLYPMIKSSETKISTVNLALMIGDVMPEVLWIVKEKGYDLLWGSCSGDITKEKVQKSNGMIIS
jgi:hypothetical protein